MKTILSRWPFWLLGLIVLGCIALPVLPLPDPLQMNMSQRLAPGSAAYPLGTDEFGRSILSRLAWGTQLTLIVGIGAAVIACLIGTVLGVIAGYMRGVSEALIMRTMDVVLCFPALLLTLLFVAIYGSGVMALMLILAVVFVPTFTRVAYASTMTVRSTEYVEATRALGAPSFYIMLKTILPNISAPVLVQLSLVIAAVVVLESGLSFLGLGITPPEASLGMMIGVARSYMAQAPMLLVWPCLLLTALILLLNAVCDQLRDILDPRPDGTAGDAK